jgi:hypothetical protein
VGVVVDLDASRRAVHAEGLAERHEELGLGGRVGEAPSERLLRVAQGVVDHLPALAALGRVDLHPVLGPARQGGPHQLRVLNLVGEEHEARGGLVVVELGHEGAEHLRRAHALVGLGEVGPVAPVLPVAEEEHLDAELPGLLVEGEHVRLLDGLGVHALRALDGGERGEPVPVAGGALELELLRGRLHLAHQPVLDRVRLAREERLRLGGQRRVLVEGDLPGAGAGAALDLVEQAGPSAVLVIAVGAGAQQEGALERVHRAVHRPDAREGAVIIPPAVPRAPVLHELGCLRVRGEQDVGERLVVPQQHVVAGLQLLDEVGLQQQRLALRGGRDELHRRVSAIMRAMRFECACPRA